MKSSSYLYLLFVLFPFWLHAQDSLSLYDKIYNRLDPVRTFNETYYYNPANMSDYSPFSFSDIQLKYQKNNKENYLLQEGKSSQIVSFNASSYKKQKNNQTIWGAASYINTQLNSVKWNNNLDLDRIGPFVMADSLGGKTNVQAYQFSGGYSKAVGRFNWGAQISYQAALSFKTIDPRPKNTTSDLELTVGGNYAIGSKYKLGVHAAINRYIQTSTISFSSEVQRAALYQMNGLGNYNFYFSSRSEKSAFTNFTHKYQLSFGSTDNTLAFNAGFIKGTLTKDTFLDSGSSSYEINRLANQGFFINVLKAVPLNHEVTIAAKIDIQTTNKSGIETYYTNNTDILQKLLEKENYKHTTNNLRFQTFFNYKRNKANLSIAPYYRQLKNTEKRLDQEVFQQFNYSFVGAELTYVQQLNKTNIISLQSNIYARKVTNANSNFSGITKASINEWLRNDYNVQSMNLFAVDAALRYDVKMDTKTSLYTIFALNLHRFSNNNTNTQTALTVGVAF